MEIMQELVYKKCCENIKSFIKKNKKAINNYFLNNNNKEWFLKFDNKNKLLNCNGMNENGYLFIYIDTNYGYKIIGNFYLSQKIVSEAITLISDNGIECSEQVFDQYKNIILSATEVLNNTII